MMMMMLRMKEKEEKEKRRQSERRDGNEGIGRRGHQSLCWDVTL